MNASHRFDVIVVGGGPAGSVMAWVLAMQGVRVAVLERVKFPREKVCGDFVEPGGLRILSRVGALATLERQDRLRIDKNRVYFGPRLVYRGPIRYYDNGDGDIDYGLIVPRHELDMVLLEAAHAAGATVICPGEAKQIKRENGMMQVEVQASTASLTLRAPLVVGADGVQSRVAQSAKLRRNDRRHTGVSQRVYLENVEVDGGEATVWFDEDIAPGYGWMFPMPGGRANFGVGFSSETGERFGLSVPDAFRTALARLRIRHPGCATARIASKPLGGVVKTYGGIDQNHFDGGVLIGDAGSFVDPLTGEGITHGMESAVLALPALMDALEHGDFRAEVLARFDDDFHRYFDPALRYLELSAALVSNRHMSEFWQRVGVHGHEEAAIDPHFAQIAGAIFGGPLLDPLAASVQMWTRTLTRYTQARSGHDGDLATRFLEDFVAFQKGWSQSQAGNREWHATWLLDVFERMLAVQKTIWTEPNPRPAGVFRFVGLEDPLPPKPPPWLSPQVRDVWLRGAFDLIGAGLQSLLPAPVQGHDEVPRRRWRAKS